MRKIGFGRFGKHHKPVEIQGQNRFLPNLHCFFMSPLFNSSQATLQVYDFEAHLPGEPEYQESTSEGVRSSDAPAEAL